MATGLTRVLAQLHRAVSPASGAGPADGQLLAHFVATRDEAAFAALVRRHGPMVFGVCRRVLRNYHDAEDAFQATFLVLARKAAAVRCDAVGSFLYAVAYRTCLEARSVNARRRARERQVEDLPAPAAAPPEAQDWRPLLDGALDRLPDKYRVPVVLCDLEGRSRQEAARQLGVPEGTLSSRLARAHALLARRLARSGLALSGGALALLLSEDAASAGVPAPLVTATTAAATGRAAAAAPVIALAEGVVRSMLLTKARIAAGFLLALGLLVAAAAGPIYRLGARDEPEERTEKRPKVGADKKPADDNRIQGSGHVETQERKVADFTSVDAGSAFQVEIRRGDTFRVAVTTDDNLFPYIKTDKDGTALRISLDTGHKSIQTHTLKVAVTMPALDGVRLDGASRATVQGFPPGKAFRAKMSGASSLEGEVRAGKVTVEASGASRVTLKGSGKDVRLTAAGASHLGLAEFTADRATVDLSGASRAEIRANEDLDYSLSGASHLDYRGNPTIGKQERSGASSVSHKAAQKKE
jgi:RNA polymerase sigma factor (sigma-70 family)